MEAEREHVAGIKRQMKRPLKTTASGKKVSPAPRSEPPIAYSIAISGKTAPRI